MVTLLNPNDVSTKCKITFFLFYDKKTDYNIQRKNSNIIETNALILT